jgi:hypothetical protein
MWHWFLHTMETNYLAQWSACGIAVFIGIALLVGLSQPETQDEWRQFRSYS